MASCPTREKRPTKNQQNETFSLHFSFYFFSGQLWWFSFNGPYFNNFVYFCVFLCENVFFFAENPRRKNQVFDVNLQTPPKKRFLRLRLLFLDFDECDRMCAFHELFTHFFYHEIVNTLCVISLDLIKWKYSLHTLTYFRKIHGIMHKHTHTHEKQSIPPQINFFFQLKCSHSRPNLIDFHIYAIL